MGKMYLFENPWKMMIFRSGWPIFSSEVVTKPSMERLKWDKSLSFCCTIINIRRQLWWQYIPWIITSFTWNTMSSKSGTKTVVDLNQMKKLWDKFAQKTGNNIIWHCYGKPRHISPNCNLKNFTPRKQMNVDFIPQLGVRQLWVEGYH